ncbi:MAG: carbon monoxide dehydrogenase subunit G [Caldilineaceae bacterium]
MKLEGTYTFDAPREAVWQALMDPTVLGNAMPGGDKLEKVGENQYEAALNVRVGPVQGKFDGQIEITNIDELNSYHMKVSGQGPSGFLNGEGDVSLSDTDEGTLMSYSGEAQVGGKIAGVGQRLIDSSAKSITRQGLESLNRQIQARVSSSEGAPVVAVAPPSAVSVAATVAKDVTRDTVSDISRSVTEGDLMAKLTTPEMLPYALGAGAVVVTLLFALISWAIAG